MAESRMTATEKYFSNRMPKLISLLSNENFLRTTK
jgi:hypothetical protein